MTYWKHGQKTEVAELAGVSRSYLSEVLGRKRNTSLKQAKRLEAAAFSASVLIPWDHWLQAKATTHPAFTGEPIGEPYDFRESPLLA